MRASSRQTLLNYAYFNFELIALINTLPGATSALTCQQHRRPKGFRNVRQGERETAGEGGAAEEQLGEPLL